MGYSTYYTLSIQGMDNDTEEFGKVIDDLRANNEDAFYAFNEEGCPEQDTTWYEHEADMKAFSLKYPDLVFNLSGEGEEQSDLWEMYFKNGKAQLCPAVITYAPYDENKLA